MAKQSGAIGADDFRLIAHVEKHVRVIERRHLADTFEFPCADLDYRHARGVVKMGYDFLGHDLSVLDLWDSRRFTVDMVS